MAVNQVNIPANVAMFIGLSSDDKPTSVAPGTKFYAYDTGVMYVCYDGTNYVVNTADGSPKPWSTKQATADTQIKAGAGILHNIIISQADAVPTAGTITLYDSLTEANTIIWTATFTTATFVPIVIPFDVAFATGLYLGFNGPADISVTVNYS